MTTPKGAGVMFEGAKYTLETILTPNIRKQSAYQSDSDFLSALSMVRDRWGATDVLKSFLWNTAALLLRPDAIAGAQASQVFPALIEHGFVPVVVRPISLSSSQTIALWRYQSNVATADRLHILDLVMSAGASIYILLNDTTVRQSAPATVHLTYLKGTAIVKNRRPGHLRTLAGPPVANVLSYLHVADEPADVLREMAVLFDEKEREGILSEIELCQDRTCEALALIAHLEKSCPPDALTRVDTTGNTSTHQSENTQQNAPSEATEGDGKLRARWAYIVRRAKSCQSFFSGEAYLGKDAIVPDDKHLSLPLDEHLITDEFGPWIVNRVEQDSPEQVEPNSAIGQLPSWLSCFPQKLAHFANDPYFRRGWRTLQRLESDGVFPVTRLWDLASILFKSDSVLRGNAVEGIRLVHQHGFDVRAGREVEFSAHGIVREFWRYALGRLTEDRVNLLEQLLAQTASFYVLVQASDSDNRLPAALRLTDLKGEVAPEKRRPEQLRRALGPPQSAMLNYVHTADEPADIVRELGILFDEDERCRVLIDVVTGCGAEAFDACERLVRKCPRSDLDVDAALNRVRCCLLTSPIGINEPCNELLGMLDRMNGGELALWPLVRAQLSADGVQIPPLDAIIISASTVRLKREQRSEVFPSCELRHWQSSGSPSPPSSQGNHLP